MSLLDRQDELQASARRALASLAPLGALMPTGSFVSGLMVWKDLERGARSPTGARRDERHHIAMALDDWRVDLSIWLYDDHAHVTAFHEALRERLTPAQRRTILEIKDVWHRRPEYPDEVSGFEIYTAVLEHGVGTPEEFGAWLAASS